MKQPPVRFCNLVMAWCINHFRYGGEDAQQKLDQWLYELDLPLPGEDVSQPTMIDEEADGESFMALMNSQAR